MSEEYDDMYGFPTERRKLWARIAGLERELAAKDRELAAAHKRIALHVVDLEKSIPVLQKYGLMATANQFKQAISELNAPEAGEVEHAKV